MISQPQLIFLPGAWLRCKSVFHYPILQNSRWQQWESHCSFVTHVDTASCQRDWRMDFIWNAMGSFVSGLFSNVVLTYLTCNELEGWLGLNGNYRVSGHGLYQAIVLSLVPRYWGKLRKTSARLAGSKSRFKLGTPIHNDPIISFGAKCTYREHAKHFKIIIHLDSDYRW